jgi:outer membrane lipoprotein carrier protein
MRRPSWIRRAGAALLAIVIALPGGHVLGAPDSDAGRVRVERFLQGLESFRADFQQVLTDRGGQVLEESIGTLEIRRPNRFRWEYSEPNEQTIVADGKKVWLYDRELEQVTVRKLDETLSATPAMLLSGAGGVGGSFNVTETMEDGGILWVRMEPKRADTDFRWVRLGFAGETLKFMQLADKLGQTTLLTFSNFERNPRLEDGRFAFRVPAGVDVIGDASTEITTPAQ